MLEKYQFIYYKLYYWNRSAFGNADMPELNALLILSFFSFSNSITLILIIDLVFATQCFELVGSNKLYLAVIAVINLIINYFLLMVRGLHKTIIAKFEKLRKNRASPKSFVVYGYIFFSIFILVVAVLFTLF